MTRVAAPMDLGDIVSAAWFLCLRRWRTVLSMASLTWAAVLASDLGLLGLMAQAQMGQSLSGPIPREPLAYAPLLGVGLLVIFYNQLAYVRYALETFAAEGARVGRCYASAARAFLPALGATMITSVAFALGAVTWVGIPLAIFFTVSWFFATQVCVGEGEVNPLRAIRRSRTIVKGSWWRAAGILAGVTLLGLLPSLAIGVLRMGNTVPSIVLSALATAVAAPFLAAAQTALYLDLRLRKHEPVTLASR